jgi:hypothetical protein
MQTYHPNQYALQDLYRDIDLFDRKIAHCRTLEKFDLEQERTAAVAKLRRQRQNLVKLALKFAADGIVYDPKFLPRSFVQGADGLPSEVVEAAQ